MDGSAGSVFRTLGTRDASQHLGTLKPSVTLLSGLRGVAGTTIVLKLLSLLCSAVRTQDELLEPFGTGESRSPLRFLVIQSCLPLMKGSLREPGIFWSERCLTTGSTDCV